jgi:hypothetical protein
MSRNASSAYGEANGTNGDNRVTLPVRMIRSIG